jgi:hypothetical protein
MKPVAEDRKARKPEYKVDITFPLLPELRAAKEISDRSSTFYCYIRDCFTCALDLELEKGITM